MYFCSYIYLENGEVDSEGGYEAQIQTRSSHKIYQTLSEETKSKFCMNIVISIVYVHNRSFFYTESMKSKTQNS